MKITNETGLPDAIVQAVVNDPYDAGDCDISVTRLIGPPQIRVLERQHDDELTEDAADRIWSLVGQIGHGILERAESLSWAEVERDGPEPSWLAMAPGEIRHFVHSAPAKIRRWFRGLGRRALTEQRLFADIEGWRISGQYDRLVLLPDGTLQDYKFTSVWACIDGPKPEWEAQLNVLRWLAEENGYPPITRLQIVAILRDWSRGKARQGGNYPQRQVKVMTVPLWASPQTNRYLVERVKLHQAADEAMATNKPLPECTDAERWARPTTYAVLKPGRKTALRVLDTEAAARELAAATPSGYVEVRPGDSIRCADYCAVSEFCAQRRAELAALADQNQAQADAA